MKNCMHEAVQGGKTRIMKYLHQFLLILAISFMGELLKEVSQWVIGKKQKQGGSEDE